MSSINNNNIEAGLIGFRVIKQYKKRNFPLIHQKMSITDPNGANEGNSNIIDVGEVQKIQNIGTDV